MSWIHCFLTLTRVLVLAVSLQHRHHLITVEMCDGYEPWLSLPVTVRCTVRVLVIVNVSAAWQRLAPQVSAATAAWEEVRTAAQTSWCLARWWTASQRKVCVCVVLSVFYPPLCTLPIEKQKIPLTSLLPFLSLVDPQRRSRRSRPAVRWKSNRRCRRTLKTQESSIPGHCSTEPRASTTCPSWRRRWLTVLMYTLQARRKRERRRWSRRWWGWESPDGAAPPQPVIHSYYLNPPIAHARSTTKPISQIFQILKCSLSRSGLFISLRVPAPERRRREPKGHERQRPPASRHLPGPHWVRTALLMPGWLSVGWSSSAGRAWNCRPIWRSPRQSWVFFCGLAGAESGVRAGAGLPLSTPFQHRRQKSKWE